MHEENQIADYITSRRVALKRKVREKNAWLPIPAIVETQEQCQQARALPLVRDVLKLVAQATIVMTGLWTTHFNEDLVARGVLTQEHLDLFQSLNPVADINHGVFDASGTCVNEQLTPPPYYLTGLEVPRLKERIRHHHAKVILVAGASPTYAAGIQAILNAGIANILITDHITAELLMENK